MRATRLVSLLLLLQMRGQLTAQELASHFEVSVRTIHRDVESLVAAGVPVEAVRGPAGGYRLAGGYRTKLTGLTAEEAETLFVARAPAAELGLGGVLANARLKVLAALPAESATARHERSGQLTVNASSRGKHRNWRQAPRRGDMTSVLTRGPTMRPGLTWYEGGVRGRFGATVGRVPTRREASHDA